jgi:hypothetical protein
MRSAKSIMITLVIILFVSVSVFASKRVYKASLNAGCEGSRARGNSFIRQLLPTGGNTNMEFTVSARRLGGEATTVTVQRSTGPQFITICSQSSTSVIGPCPVREWDPDFNDLVLDFSAQLTPEVLQTFGITGAQFQQWADDGQLYITVGTSLCSEDARAPYARVDNN